MSSFSRAAINANAALLRTFGETVTYQAASGNSFEISVVWDEEESRMPKNVRAIAWVQESDLATGGVTAARKTDMIKRGDAIYRIIDPPDGLDSERDGTGGRKLYLRQERNVPST